MPRLPRLAVGGVLPAARAELLQLQPVGVVPRFLLGGVGALLATRAHQRRRQADGRLGHPSGSSAWVDSPERRAELSTRRPASADRYSVILVTTPAPTV